MKKTVYAAIFVAVALCVVVVVGLLSASVNLGFQGKIVGIGVSVSPNALEYGNVAQGSFNSLTVTLTDTGNANEVLIMSVPNLPSYLSLTWNCSNTVLTPSLPVVALFTLAVAANASLGSFSFTVTINGVQN